VTKNDSRKKRKNSKKKIQLLFFPSFFYFVSCTYSCKELLALIKSPFFDVQRGDYDECFESFDSLPSYYACHLRLLEHFFYPEEEEDDDDEAHIDDMKMERCPCDETNDERTDSNIATATSQTDSSSSQSTSSLPVVNWISGVLKPVWHRNFYLHVSRWGNSCTIKISFLRK